MNVVDATLFYIIQLLLHALHIACKIVDVEHHVILLVPVRAFLSARIRCTQIGISLHVEAFHIVAQLCKHGAVAIKLHIQPAQLLKVPVKPLPVRRFDCILACFLGCLCLAQCSLLLSCRNCSCLFLCCCFFFRCPLLCCRFFFRCPLLCCRFFFGYLLLCCRLFCCRLFLCCRFFFRCLLLCCRLVLSSHRDRHGRLL